MTAEPFLGPAGKQSNFVGVGFGFDIKTDR